MTVFTTLEKISTNTETILGEPFEWCFVKGGMVSLINASDYGGSKGGDFHVGDFAIAKYFITNSQYQKFIDDPDGFSNHEWWSFSSEGKLWRRDHRRPKPAAFQGKGMPATRISWFDSIAFCRWLSARLNKIVRLPTELEWQRAAVGDTGWFYPWGNKLEDKHANYGNKVQKTSPVGSYPAGQSPFGVMDMIGNLWEWNLIMWGTDNDTDLNGYAYRNYRGGAWNVSNPEYLRAIDRGVGHSPRGRLNDCGFRIALEFTS